MTDTHPSTPQGTQVDVEKLRKAAQNHPHQHWRFEWVDRDMTSWRVTRDDGVAVVRVDMLHDDEIADKPGAKESQFIAAANPAVVLALLDRLAMAEASGCTSVRDLRLAESDVVVLNDQRRRLIVERDALLAAKEAAESTNDRYAEFKMTIADVLGLPTGKDDGVSILIALGELKQAKDSAESLRDHWVVVAKTQEAALAASEKRAGEYRKALDHLYYLRLGTGIRIDDLVADMVEGGNPDATRFLEMMKGLKK